MNWLKKYGWIILIVIGIAIGAFFYIRKKTQDITFDFTITGDITSLLNSLQSSANSKGIGLYLDVPVTTTINNKSSVSTILSNIIGSISYMGQTIMQTNANSPALQNISVTAKSSTPVTDSVQVLINPSSIKFFSEVIKGKKPEVQYNISTIISGKPYNFINKSKVV